MPQRLAELMTAIGREQDPAVRGRAAAQLLRDLARARASAQEALAGAIRELRAAGLSEQRIDALLQLPLEQTSAARELRPQSGREERFGPTGVWAQGDGLPQPDAGERGPAA